MPSGKTTNNEKTVISYDRMFLLNILFLRELSMKKILLLNGPNLNRLGKREPGIYGVKSLEDLENQMVALGTKFQIEVICFQSNHEGELIDKLHEAEDTGVDGIIFNPGAFTHYSYAKIGRAHV